MQMNFFTNICITLLLFSVEGNSDENRDVTQAKAFILNKFVVSLFDSVLFIDLFVFSKSVTVLVKVIIVVILILPVTTIRISRVSFLVLFLISFYEKIFQEYSLKNNSAVRS